MNPPNHEQVESTFIQVAQNLAMLFAEPSPIDESLDEFSAWHIASILFTGEAKGKLTLAIPDSLQQEMTMNFMGLDAGDPEVSKFADDTLREFVNVLCGNLLSTWAGEEPVFNLGQPQIEGRAGFQSSTEPGSHDFHFDIEGVPAILSLEITA